MTRGGSRVRASLDLAAGKRGAVVRAVLALVLACGPGCAETSRTVRPPASRAARPVEVHASSGIAFEVLPFDTAGFVRLSAYVRAGARDATTPGTAALAATLLAESVAPDAKGIATVDTIEIAWVVARSQLDESVGALVRGLSTRRFDDGAFERAKASLLARRITAALDPLREGEAIASAGVLGIDASRADPLGARSDDAPTRDEVEAFLAANVRAAGTLLVAAGDASRDDLEGALSRVRTRLPDGPPPAREATRSARPVGVGRLGSHAVAVLAAILPEDASSDARVAAIRRSLDAGIEGDVSVASLPTALGRLVTVRVVEVDDPFDAVARTAREVAIGARLLLSPDEEEHDVERASRALGFRFAANTAAPDERTAFAPSMSAYVEVREPRARPRDEQDESAAEAALGARARDAIARGLADSAPNVVGNIAPGAAEVVVGEGVVVRALRTRHGRDIGLAVRLEHGGAPHPPGLDHVLALALARACSGAEPLRYGVDARGITLLERASESSLSDVAERVLPCVLERVPGDPAFDEALREAMSTADERLFESDFVALASVAGDELASILAPSGARATLARIDSSMLRAALAEMRHAEHVRVAIVGDLVPARAVAIIAPRVSAQPAGARRATSAPDVPSQLLATHRATALPLLLLLIRVRATADDDDAAALATAIERRFASRGIRVFASRAAPYGDSVFAGLLLDADAPGVDDAEAIARESIRDRAAFDAAREARRGPASLALADPTIAAARLTARGPEPAHFTIARDADVQVASVVGRAQPLGETSFDPTRRVAPLAPRPGASRGRPPARRGTHRTPSRRGRPSR